METKTMEYCYGELNVLQFFVAPQTNARFTIEIYFMSLFRM